MYSKHKDATPAETIARIRDCYQSLDLEMDCRVERHIDGVYSAYILDVRSGWNAAGKGTTEEYCLASAYGESMEHLCNHFAFDISKTGTDAQTHMGFLRYPDEVWLPIHHIREAAPAVFQDMERCFAPDESGMTLELVWQAILGERTPFIPYYSIAQKQTVMLPDAVLSKMCGSNGGGSGNTPEEAIGHALDEILERHAKYRIIYDRLTPPTIPPEYIHSRCPELYDLIRRIEKTGGLSVIVKDASLGQGYSVVCILVIDAEHQRYLANFGAHPCFEIALERCLTELFQDHDCVEELLKREEMIPWGETSEERLFGLSNWVSLLRDDIGQLPDSIFGTHTSWKFEPWPVYTHYTNKIGMRHQLEILLNNGLDVYIRNNSFLGFPVYKVYVPFLSCSHLKFDRSMVIEADMANQIHRYLTEGISAEQEMYLCRHCFGPDSFLLNMALRNWDGDHLCLLQAAALFDTGHTVQALSALENTTLKECVFLKRYIQLTLGQNESRDELLRLFFGKKADRWLDALARGKAFSLVQECCARCGLIRSKDSLQGTTSPQRDILYMRIKEAFAKTAPDQTGTIGMIQ